MKRSGRKYFKFMNVRTGQSAYYGNGRTVNEHMALMRMARENTNRDD